MTYFKVLFKHLPEMTQDSFPIKVQTQHVQNMKEN